MGKLPNPPVQDVNVGSFAWLNWYKNVTITVNNIGGSQIQLTGDVSGNGSLGTPITVALATTGVAAGTYNNVTVDTKGRVTNGSSVAYLTGNQSISLSGDVTGSGTTSIPVALASSGVTAGTYNNVTVNTKGIATGGSNLPYGRTDQANTWSQGQTFSTTITLQGTSGVTFGTYGSIFPFGSGLGFNSSLYDSNGGSFDIGVDGNRFRNIKLTGGVYLGNGGTALTAYTTGTFNPNPSANYNIASLGAVSGAKYTQIGNKVFYEFTVPVTPTTANVNTAILFALPIPQTNPTDLMFGTVNSYSAGDIGLVVDDTGSDKTTMYAQVKVSTTATSTWYIFGSYTL